MKISFIWDWFIIHIDKNFNVITTAITNYDLP